MDKFKEYLQNNRDKLDIYEADDIQFDKILSEVKGFRKPPKTKHHFWIGIAASIVLGLILFNIGYKYGLINNISETDIANNSQSKRIFQDSVVKSVEQSPVNGSTPLAHKVDHTGNVLAKVNKEKKSINKRKQRATEIDSINLVYSKITNKYLNDIHRALAADQVELEEVNKQLHEMELDEAKIHELIGEFGPNEHLIAAMIRLNQQKIIYLQRVYRPLIKRERFL
jgi:hypothetical protein